MTNWSDMSSLSRGFHQLFLGIVLIGMVFLKFGGPAGLFVYLGWVISILGIISLIVAGVNFCNWIDGK